MQRFFVIFYTNNVFFATSTTEAREFRTKGNKSLSFSLGASTGNVREFNLLRNLFRVGGSRTDIEIWIAQLHPEMTSIHRKINNNKIADLARHL